MAPPPNNSRTAPNKVSANENPSPIPNPSTMDEHTLFFEANASARPSTRQFTTISGINKSQCIQTKQEQTPAWSVQQLLQRKQ